MSSDVQDKDFYNVFDGIHGRPEGRYLDMDERIEAEKTRALREGREPDLSDLGKLPAGVGTPLVVDELRVDNRNYSNPATLALGPRDVDPVSTLGVDLGTADQDFDLSQAAMVARERKANDEALVDDPSGTTFTSENPDGAPVVDDPAPVVSEDDE